LKPVLCVRNDRYDTLGITQHALVGEGVAVQVVDAFAPGVRLPSIEEICGLVVFGGEMNVDEVERYPYLLTQRQLMVQAIESGVPVLGICLGAQMLARALGSRVYRAPVRELGFVPVRLTEAGQKDPLLSAFETGDRVFEWHMDTFDLPAGSTLLATGDQVNAQAFRAGDSAWGVQFHFEINTEGIEAWLKVSEPGFERAWERTTDSVRDELRKHLPSQQQRSRRLFRAFAKRVQRGEGTAAAGLGG
jgi:GMP synthase (glutamine-hydrolysing)